MSHLTHDQDQSSDLHVTHLVKGLGPGGAERLVLNQLQTTSGGIDYSVLRLIDEKNHLVDDIESTGARSELIGGSLTRSAGFVPMALARALRNLRPDIVHAHSPILAAQVRVLSKLGLVDAPIITTEHNRWPRHHKATRLVNRVTARLDSARLAVSEDVLESMDRGLRSSTNVLDHGVPVDEIQALRSQRQRIRSELGLTTSSVAVGIVANFRPEKSYDVFLAAAIEASQQNPELEFIVVGQGPGEAAFRQAVAQCENPDAITVLGYQANATEVMSALDVFTLSSRHEGKPVSIMEAMSLGLPIAATRAGGIPEMVEHGRSGLLAEIGDSSGLADAYLELAADQDLRTSLGATAEREASARFDASRSTRSIESLYRSVISAD